jgi:phosphoribosylglycinamide formyltransferase 1
MLTRWPPLRVALLCSARAPGLATLLEDPARGRLYELVACLTSDDAFRGHEPLHRHGIPCLRHSIQSFYRWQHAPIGDLARRHDYDAASLRLLAPYEPDLVVLSGYLYVLSHTFLRAFPDRILNVHHADLLLKRGGAPLYPGLRAVRDAVLAGETETRATLHVVTPAVDAGPLLLRSWAFPVAPLARQALAWGATDLLRAYARAHEQWMLHAAFGPLLARAIALCAQDRVTLRDGAALVDGQPGPLDLSGLGPPPWTEDGTAREALGVAGLAVAR